MSTKRKEYSDILDIYRNNRLERVYNTKELDERGINYTDFIKLRCGVILNKTISKVSINGWYILWLLLAYSRDKKYIKTTVKQLQSYIELSTRQIITALQKLQKYELIYIDEYDENTEIKLNETLEILILYHDGTLYANKNPVFKAIPTDYVKRMIPNVSPKEFAVWCVLTNYHRYFVTGDTINKETGEIIYFYSKLGYAFPKQDDIGNLIGMNYHSIHPIVKLLAEKRLISYEASSEKATTIQQRIQNPNYRYRIKLFQRIEYMAYCIVNPDIPDNRNNEVKGKIKNKGFENIACSDEQDILVDRDYIKFEFSLNLHEFRNALSEGCKRSIEIHHFRPFKMQHLAT